MPAVELLNTAFFTDPNLRAYYRLESGALTTDSGPNGYTLTNNNTVGNATGMFGSAADFGAPNTNKSLSRTDTLGIAGVDSMTISMWVKFTTIPTSGNVIGLFSIFPTSGIHTVINYDNTSGSPRFRMQSGGNNTNYDFTFSTGVWYHMAFVKNGTTSTIIYVDATQVATGTVGGSTTAGTSVHIGRDTISATFHTGLIDDLAVFNRVLTAAEVARIFTESGGSNFIPFL